MYRILLIYLIFSVFIGCSSSDPGLAEDPGGGGGPGPQAMDEWDPTDPTKPGGWSGNQVVDRDLALVSFVTGQLVFPNLGELKSNANSLHQMVSKACETESVSLKTLRDRWESVMTSYHYLESMAFGPLNAEESTLPSYIYSLPQLGGEALVDRELTFSESQGLDYKPDNPRPVIMGLDALEYVLFGILENETSIEPGAPQCGFLFYLTFDLQERAAKLVSRFKSEELGFLVSPDGQTRLKEYIGKMTDSLYFADTNLKDRKISAPLGKKQDPYFCTQGVDCHSLYLEHPYATLYAKKAIATNLQALDDLLYGKEDFAKSYGYVQFLKDLAKESGENINLDTGLDNAQSSWQKMPEGEEYVLLFEGVGAQANILNQFVSDLQAVTTWLKSDFISGLNVELPGGVQGDND